MSLFSRFKSPTKTADKAVYNALPAFVQAQTNTLIQLKAAAKGIKLEQKLLARAATAGLHASAFRGRGMDYQESRLYQAGDDIRSMDWRVTARVGKPHTKLYQEERERPVVFFVDLHPGMFFGTQQSFKSVVLAKAVSLLAWATAQAGDRVGALVIDGNDSGHLELSPKSGSSGVLQIIRALVKRSHPIQAGEPPQNTDFNDELRRLSRLAKPGTLIFLVSDFFNIDNDTQRHLQRLKKHSDVMAIQILDPIELQLPQAGTYPITNGQSQRWLDLESTRGREQFATFFQEKHRIAEDLFKQTHIPLLKISTQDDVVARLQKQFSGKHRGR